MNPLLIVPIVEGHGEVEALPLLIRRIFGEFHRRVSPVVNPPTRVKARSFLHDHDYFNKYVALAAAKADQGDGMVLILLDCEDHCPGTLGPRLLTDAQAVRDGIRCGVALAHRDLKRGFLRRRPRYAVAPDFQTVSRLRKIPNPSVEPRSGWESTCPSPTTPSSIRQG